MPAIAIRSATAADAGTLLRLVRALAAYENLADKVVSSEEDLRRDGFGPHPAFEARIVSLDGEDVGFTLFYPSYSTFAGRACLFLEDLFVDPAARGHGLGRLLLADLSGATVRGTDFGGADLSGATWTDGKRVCAEGSIGQCN